MSFEAPAAYLVRPCSVVLRFHYTISLGLAFLDRHHKRRRPLLRAEDYTILATFISAVRTTAGLFVPENPSRTPYCFLQALIMHISAVIQCQDFVPCLTPCRFRSVSSFCWPSVPTFSSPSAQLIQHPNMLALTSHFKLIIPVAIFASL